MLSDIPPRKLLGVAFLVLIGCYALFQARYLILGPRLVILEPEDGYTATSSLVYVRGTAKNVTFISLNDRPIFLSEKGGFEERLLVHPGLSTIIIKARDRFGRETEKITRIVLAN